MAETLEVLESVFYNDLVGRINTKAPSASPTFTGIPTAPTAPQTANTVQLATTAFVKAAIAALVNGSPEMLNQFNEFAAAIGNNPNFATDILNIVGQKAPTASPTFTGTPASVTPNISDSSTRIATTAFVQMIKAAILQAQNDALLLKANLRAEYIVFDSTVTAITLGAAHLGKILVFMSPFDIGVTISDDLGAGFICSFRKGVGGTSKISPVASGTATLVFPTGDSKSDTFQGATMTVDTVDGYEFIFTGATGA